VELPIETQPDDEPVEGEEEVDEDEIPTPTPLKSNLYETDPPVAAATPTAKPLPILVKVLDEKYPTVAMAMTSDKNPIIERIKFDVVVSPAHEAALKEFLTRSGFGNSPIYIEQVISADIDNDGFMEDVIVAGTPKGENGFPIVTEEDVANLKDRAIYYAVIVVKDSYVTPIYFKAKKIAELHLQPNSTEYALSEAFSVRFIGLYDFNFDKKVELSIAEAYANSKNYSVWAVDSASVYKRVLFSEFTW
jgi:hypothetical protein